MSEEQDNSNRRDSAPSKPYEPPTVTRVSLRPEEAVLGACKTASTSGPATPGTPCAYPVPCPSPGS